MSRAFVQRLPGFAQAKVDFTVDGTPCQGYDGDTVLTALLAAGLVVRHAEPNGESRAGFCFIGACQDCWVWDDAGVRVRACTTPLAAGMALRTRPV